MKCGSGRGRQSIGVLRLMRRSRSSSSSFKLTLSRQNYFEPRLVVGMRLPINGRYGAPLLLRLDWLLRNGYAQFRWDRRALGGRWAIGRECRGGIGRWESKRYRGLIVDHLGKRREVHSERRRSRGFRSGLGSPRTGLEVTYGGLAGF